MKKMIIRILTLALIIGAAFLVSRYNIISNFFAKSKEASVQIPSLNIEAIRDLSQLRVFSYNMDFLFIAKDENNNYYVAIYPYTVEAGIDLNKIKSEEKVYSKGVIYFPSPEIFYYGESFDKKPIIVTDQIKIDSSYYKDNIKEGFKMYSRDVAINKGIYEKTEKALKEYLKKFVPEEYDLKFSEPDNNFTKINAERFQAYFKLTNELYRKYKFSDENGKYFAEFLNKEDPEIKFTFNFSQEYKKDHKTFFNDVESKFKGELCYKLVNPDNPFDYNYSFKINRNKNTLIGFILNGGDLINFKFNTQNEEDFKKYTSDFIYYMFSYRNSQNKNYTEVGKYKDFINYLYKSQIAIDEEKINTLENLGENILSLQRDVYSEYGNLFINLEKLIEKNIDTSENINDYNLKLLAKAYYYINNKDKRIIELIDDLKTWFEKNENIENAFEPYLMQEYYNWNINEKISLLKDKVMTYLMINYKNYLKNDEIEKYKREIINEGIYYSNVWNNIINSDIERKEYLKRIYLNIVKNQKLEHYLYYDKDKKLVRIKDFNDPDFYLSDIYYDFQVKDKYNNIILDSDSLANAFVEMYEKFSEKEKENFKSLIKDNFDDEYYFFSDVNSKKFFKNNFIIVLTRNAFNLPKNAFKVYTVFVFGKNGLLLFETSKKIFGDGFKLKYQKFIEYSELPEKLEHKNASIKAILDVLNDTESNNLTEEICENLKYLIRFILRNKVNVFVL
ncbi:hypothetical protein LN42_02425 [Marinitoga sp. 1137]|uniref:DUF4230 domain-containing protein n=1 Tax=Marinitoga sp. 1137 TaxID=1545835 RepID=UPI0009506AE8|nr:DUF4230 domain-containing protein [Marinitoga sp. 1137]APT75367.1 hypothetical protein LN42_02425 [Marinitoga sp. 1137]